MTVIRRIFMLVIRATVRGLASRSPPGEVKRGLGGETTADFA
jgi:hypothetical protein